MLQLPSFLILSSLFYPPLWFFISSFFIFYLLHVDVQHFSFSICRTPCRYTFFHSRTSLLLFSFYNCRFSVFIFACDCSISPFRSFLSFHCRKFCCRPLRFLFFSRALLPACLVYALIYYLSIGFVSVYPHVCFPHLEFLHLLRSAFFQLLHVYFLIQMRHC